MNVKWFGLFKKEMHIDSKAADIFIVLESGRSAKKKLDIQQEWAVNKEEVRDVFWPVVIESFEASNLNINLEDKSEIGLPTLRLKNIFFKAKNI